MKIQHNIAALNAYRSYGKNTDAVSKNLEKLSSGYRINRAADDAAGLAISEKMRAQITGLGQAQRNAQDGISLVQTAEGALTEVHSVLNRMVELADQSANGTYQDEIDRIQLQKEITALKSEIDRIADSTNFNGIPLLDGTIGNGGGVSGGGHQGGGAAGGGTVVHMSDVYDTTRLNFSMGGVHGGKGTISGNLILTADNAVADNTIELDIDNNGSVVIYLGCDTQNCTYNTKLVETEVRKQAADMLKNPAATNAQKAVAEALQKFTIQENVTLTADTVATGTTTAMPFKVQGGGDTGGTGEDVGIGEGGAGVGVELHIGDTSDDFNTLIVELADMHTNALGIDGISIETQANAKTAVDIIKNAINKVSDVRGTLGATQNRLEHTINNLSVTTENMAAAESRIRDVDIAKEMMTYIKNNILVQSSQAILAQANQTPQGVLQLLQ